jgi:hypothetical protein
VGLERGSLSLVSTTEELLGRKTSGSSTDIREYGHGDPLCSPHDTLYPQKSALTLPTSGGRSFGTVPSRTKATVFNYYYHNHYYIILSQQKLKIPASGSLEIFFKFDSTF